MCVTLSHARLHTHSRVNGIEADDSLEPEALVDQKLQSLKVVEVLATRLF